MSMLTSEDELTKIANIIGGNEAVLVVVALKELNEATDDEISAKTGTRLNDVRKALFKLHGHSIVVCNRSRDEKTGWFIFRWKLQPEQMEAFIRSQKTRVLEKLETRYEHEGGHEFYYCTSNGCQRMTFEDAMEFVFRCPMCGKTLQRFDNDPIKRVLKVKVDQLRKELSE